MNWQYLNAAGEQVPFDDSQLQSLIDGGEITGDTQIWREDLPDWVQARELLDGIDGAPKASATATPVIQRNSSPASATSISNSAGALAPTPADAPPTSNRSASQLPVTQVSAELESGVVRSLAGVFSPASRWMKLVSALLIFLGLVYGLVGLGLLLGGIFGGEVIGGLIVGSAVLILAVVPFWLGILAWKGGGYSAEAAQTGSRQAFETSLDSTRKFFTILGVLLLIKLLLIAALVIFMLMGGATALMMRSMGMGDRGSMGELEGGDMGSMEEMMEQLEGQGLEGMEGIDIEQVQEALGDMGGLEGVNLQEALQQVDPAQIQGVLEGMNLEGLGLEGIDLNQIQGVLEGLQGAGAPE